MTSFEQVNQHVRRRLPFFNILSCFSDRVERPLFNLKHNAIVSFISKKQIIWHLLQLLMSTFQQLPYLVIKKISSYYLEPYSFLDDPAAVSLAKWRRLSPLLWLCSSWRSAVLQFVLKEYIIVLGENKVQHYMRMWPTDLELPVPYAASWVNILHVWVTFPMVKNIAGKLPNIYRSFCLAHSLLVNVNQYQGLKHGYFYPVSERVGAECW